MAKAFYQRPFKATNPQTLRLRSFFPAKLFKRYLDEIVKKDLVPPTNFIILHFAKVYLCQTLGIFFDFIYKAVVPDFFCQFILFSHFGKLNYPQIKMYVRDLSTQNVFCNTRATGYKDINMNEFYNSNINQFLFYDFVMLLLMR